MRLTTFQPNDGRSVPTRDRLKTLIEFRIPGFEKQHRDVDGKAFYFDRVDSHHWYRMLRDDIVGALNAKRYFPIYRMGDGEYSFALGSFVDVAPIYQLNWKQIARRVLRATTYQRQSHRSGYKEVGYEYYSRGDISRARTIFVDALRVVAKDGALALGLDTSPLYSRYYPMILDWFDRNGVYLHKGNYHHVYSMYALLSGKDSTAIISGRNVLIVSGLIEDRKAVNKRLAQLGAKSVAYLSVSATESMFDVLDLERIEGTPELVFVSAGVGTVNILKQLKPLACPCLDVGFFLRTLVNADLRWDRPFCVPDEEFEWSKVRWLSADGAHQQKRIDSRNNKSALYE